MDNLTELVKADEIKEGAMKSVNAGGREILVAKSGGKYYAADNRCPHMNGDLSMGKLEGTVVTCPRHGSKFDLADGRLIRWTDWLGIMLTVAKILKSPRPLRTYRVQVEGDKVMAEIPAKS